MVVAEPEIGDVFPTMVRGDFGGREVVVVIDDGLAGGNFMVKAARGFREEEEIFIEISHVGTDLKPDWREGKQEPLLPWASKGGCIWRNSNVKGLQFANWRGGDSFTYKDRRLVFRMRAEVCPLCSDTNQQSRYYEHYTNKRRMH